MLKRTGPADTDKVCLPEREPSVLLKSVQTNQGSHPILAGPVAPGVTS